MRLKANTIGSGCAGFIAVFTLYAGLSGCSPTGSQTSRPTRPAAQSADPAPPTGKPVRGESPQVQPAALFTTPEQRAQFVGDAQCTGCHAREAAEPDNRHAHTVAVLAPAAERSRFETPANMVDPKGQSFYQTAFQNGRCILRCSDQQGEEVAEADYTFGSGRRAITYLGVAPSGPVQLRLSWYPKHGWWWTPGLIPGSTLWRRSGQPLGEQGVVRCFSCHTSALVRSSAGVDLDHSVLGVGCEGCHGPGKAHMEAARRKEKDLQMVRFAAQRQAVSTVMCGRCHTKPGEIDHTNPVQAKQLPRFSGSALALSRCFTEGKVTCMDCHNPHRNVEESPAAYNRVCASCHTTAGSRSPVAARLCPVQPRGDCVSCHLPAQSTGLPVQRQFHNHWIKVWGKAGGDQTGTKPHSGG